MTITLTKTKLAISVLTVVLVATTAVFAAAHPFKDVPAPGVSGAPFYSSPVQWAWDNSLTTGSPGGSDTFKPLDPVTRGENITFNFRYDSNIVQPALSTLTAGIAGTYTKAQVDAAVAAALLGTATIPSGTTVTGAGNWDYASIVDNADVWIDVQLPGVAPVGLNDESVNFQPSGILTESFDEDAACTGNASAPTAPPGKVCIYHSDSVNLDGLYGSAADVVGFEDRLFYVTFNIDAAILGTDVFLDFSWAYTAP